MLRMTVLAVSLAAAAGSAHAGPAEVAAIEAGCTKSLNWSAAACRCFAEKAGSTLNDKQQAFMAATLVQDKAGVAMLAVQLSQAEMMQAGMFPSQAGPACQ